MNDKKIKVSETQCAVGSVGGISKMQLVQIKKSISGVSAMKPSPAQNSQTTPTGTSQNGKPATGKK